MATTMVMPQSASHTEEEKKGGHTHTKSVGLILKKAATECGRNIDTVATDDSMSDDVFESPEESRGHSTVLNVSPSIAHQHPSPTGYRDYQPPADVLALYESDREEAEQIVHKTILLGDSGVGKTSLLVQFDTGKFQQGNFSATVGIGFTVSVSQKKEHLLSVSNKTVENKVVNVGEKKVKLQIWDTAGQERFRSVTHAYYRDAHALLLLYDVTNKTSFDNIRAWLGEIREYAQDDVVIMLLGNKTDCGSNRSVQKEDGDRLAREYRVMFLETSAKTGLNVELAFMAVARQLIAKKSGNSDASRFNVQDYVREQAQHGSCPPCIT